MNLKGLGALAAMAAIIAAAHVPTSSASETTTAELGAETHDHSDDDDHLVPDPEDVLELTASYIATGRGITQAEARAALDLQFEVDKIGADLRAAHPDGYVGAYRSSPTGGYVLMFKGQAPASVTSRFSKHPMVEIDDGYRFTKAEMVDLTIALSHAYNDRGYAVAVTPDVRGQRFDVHLEGDIFESAPNTAEVLNSALAVLRAPAAGRFAQGTADATAADIQVVMVPEGATSGTLDWANGGDEYIGANTAGCTTGFTAKRNGLQKWGIITADHCDSGNTFNNLHAGHNHGSISGGFLLQLIDGYVHDAGLVTHNSQQRVTNWDHLGDVMYRSNGGVERNHVYINYGVKIQITNVILFLDLDEGDFVCRFGRTSGQGTGSPLCPWISDPYTTWTIDGNVLGGAVTATTTNPVGGDSGGPWWIGNSAVGIHHGKNAAQTMDRMSIVDLAQSALNVSVMTS